jgi:uncharacterized paraquat-inducible protein A
VSYMRLPPSGRAIGLPGVADGMDMQLAICHECEKVWLTPALEEGERRECTDCGSLLEPVERAEAHEDAAHARAGT